MSQTSLRLKDIEALTLGRGNKNVIGTVYREVILVLSNSLAIFTQELQRILEKVFLTLNEAAFGRIKEEWAMRTSRFIRKFSNIVQTRKGLSNHLKYRLSHPQYANELELLDKSADGACNDIRILIENFTADIRNIISNIMEDSLDKLEYAVISFTGLFDAMLLAEDIKVPGNFFD
jgi:ABC-type multidrug transport system fused ATPase/permease subunit